MGDMKTLAERLRKFSNGLSVISYMGQAGQLLNEASALTIEAAYALASHEALIAELEEALRGLANVADGLSFREIEIRNIIGNTNWTALRHWVNEARTIADHKEE